MTLQQDGQHGFIDAAGHDHWVPLPLDVPLEQLEADLGERYAGTMPRAELANSVAAAIGVARTLAASPSWEETGVATCAAWQWVRDPDTFVPAATAVLRATAVDAGQTVDDCIGLVVGDTPLQGGPVVGEVETSSGTAYAVRFRPVVRGDRGDSEVHQVVAVLWPRLESRVLFVLTTYTTDLVEGAELGDALEELAAGMTGI
ncbi:MAG: hypothetical protein ACXV4A_08820 [Actinomycetes bacterium]